MFNRFTPAPALRRTCLLAALCAGTACMWAPVAHASDFTQFCEANSALDTGKLSDADKKSCACVKAKLDVKIQDDAGTALEKVLAQRKSGKSDQKPDLSPEQNKAMEAFVGATQGCVAPNQ